MDISSEDDFVNLHYPLFANSFGPYLPASFFDKKNQNPIVWILSEPYIAKESWVKGDRGGHDQAQQYNTLETIYEENNSTQNNIIDVSTRMMKNIYDDYFREEKIFENIAVIELNHFPGLAFGSTSTDDETLWKWGELHMELLNFYINFLEPRIILGKNYPLGIFSNARKEYDMDLFNWLTDHDEECLRSDFPKVKLLNSRICKTFNKKIEYFTKKEKSKQEPIPNSKLVSACIDDKDRIWIGHANHISTPVWTNEEFKTKFAHWASNLLPSNFK